MGMALLASVVLMLFVADAVSHFEDAGLRIDYWASLCRMARRPGVVTGLPDEPSAIWKNLKSAAGREGG